MSPWWHGVAEDFSDIPDVSQIVRLLVRLLLAAILGGILGYERTQAGKDAGLRTHMLVALGAAMFVLIPDQAGMQIADMSRVIQGVVAGIGFLGAGAILKQSSQQEIKGLTTAAGLWLTAAIGVAAGLGRETTAIAATVLAWIILSLLMRVERRFIKQDDDDKRPDTDSGKPPSSDAPQNDDATT